jgi:hypothetical protein
LERVLVLRRKSGKTVAVAVAVAGVPLLLALLLWGPRLLLFLKLVRLLIVLLLGVL